MGIGLIQPMHLLLILVIVLVVFGAGKLSQVGGALGQSVKDFKQSVAEDEAELPAAGAAAGAARAEQGHPPVPAPGSAAPLRREEI